MTEVGQCGFGGGEKTAGQEKMAGVLGGLFQILGRV